MLLQRRKHNVADETETMPYGETIQQIKTRRFAAGRKRYSLIQPMAIGATLSK
jgi:hypothetical protein